MRLWQRCLRISLVLNLALAVVALGVAVRRSTVRSAVAPQPQNNSALSFVPNAVVARPNVHTITNSFRWTQIESEDFPTYIANLRAIGCPERTIADIIIADVADLYEQKRALVPLDARFWETDIQAHRAWQKRVEEQLRLQREKTALLEQFLGVRWFDWPPDNSHDIPIMQFFSGILEDNQAAQLVARYELLKQEKRLLQSARFDVVIPSDHSRDKLLTSEYVADLVQLIGSAQMEELRFRNMAVALFEKLSKVSMLSLTPAQCRQMAQAALASLPVDALIPMDDSINGLSQQLMEMERFQIRLREILGETTFTRYKLATAPQFRTIENALEKSGLAKTLAFEIAGVAIEAEKRSKDIRATTALTGEMRTAALHRIRLEVEEAIGGVAGTNRTQFLQENEAWLQGLEAHE